MARLFCQTQILWERPKALHCGHNKRLYIGPFDSNESTLAPESIKHIMERIDWENIITAYRNGLTADLLQAEFQREQGVIWTVPPCSPEALERAGRQFSRSRAARILHIRRAVLRGRDRPDQAVVVATELPAHRQQVRDLVTAEEIVLRRLLSDAALAALEAAFTPLSETAV